MSGGNRDSPPKGANTSPASFTPLVEFDKAVGWPKDIPVPTNLSSSYLGGEAVRTEDTRFERRRKKSKRKITTINPAAELPTAMPTTVGV